MIINGIILVFLYVITTINADPMHNGFMTKWSSNSSDGDSFFKLPRTKTEADTWTGEDAWILVENNPNYYVYCQNENERFCPIFDLNGFIAGMQIGIPFEDIATNIHAYPFDTNPYYQKLQRFGRDTWVVTAYFISPIILAQGGRTSLNEGTLEQLWVQNGISYADSKQIPLDPSVLVSTTAYKEERCVSRMGLHYYYNITQNLPCEEFQPWFLLYQNNQIIGLGFQAFGKSVIRPNIRHYSENVGLLAGLYVFYDPPSCISTWIPDDNIISLHTYFIDGPDNILPC